MSWRLMLLLAFFLSVAAGAGASAPEGAQGCAFPTVPNTYEASRTREAYLIGEELAGFNLIRSDDSYFGTPNIEVGTRTNRRVNDAPYIPPTLLKAIGYVESGITQAAGNVPFNAVGPALISFDCGHGIMQITSGMTSGADGGGPSKNQALVATHYLFNIARGAAILADKWNSAPEFRPIAGTDTDSDPQIFENWYFATWSYNGFTGPGANRSNHPADDVYTYPRTPFSCGPADDGYGHTYGNFPYQEIVFGCASRPPSVNGEELWSAPSVPFALPDLSNPDWSDPLDVDETWIPCSRDLNCAGMDMRSPVPWHYDDTPRPSNGTAAFLLGSPQLTVSRATLDEGTNDIVISNSGRGILAWRAKAGQSWVSINKQGGIAISPDVVCDAGNPCERSPTLRVTVSGNHSTGWVDLESLTTGQTIRLSLASDAHDVNCDGRTNTIDATLLLQFDAGIVASLPCAGNADVNRDGRSDALDAVLILQYNAGLINLPLP